MPQLLRASVELAKEWRSDKHLRRMLNAVLVVADKDVSLTLSGNGDVLEHADGVCGIGSGGIYAQCAALALKDIPVRKVSQCIHPSALQQLKNGNPSTLNPDSYTLPLLLHLSFSPPLPGAERRGCREALDEDCERHLHLHQPQLRDRDNRLGGSGSSGSDSSCHGQQGRGQGQEVAGRRTQILGGSCIAMRGCFWGCALRSFFML